MTLLERLRAPTTVTRSPGLLSGFFGGLDPGGFTFNGTWHDLQSMPGSPPMEVGEGFAARIRDVHERSGPVAAAVVARQWPLSQTYPRWRNMATGNLYGNPDLAMLQRPHPYTRANYFAMQERHASYAGNAYTRVMPDGSLRVVRPDWVELILYSEEEPESPAFGTDAAVIGYLCWPGGKGSGSSPVPVPNFEMIHWAPEPHPTFPWLGESWITGVLREIVADGQATDHVTKFFEHAATSNMVITAPEGITKKQFEDWVDDWDDKHAGAANAWKNIYLAHGSDVTVVGSSLGDIGMADLQGGFETRITTRSRVPATVLGTREGLSGSALNQGNYDSARRLWADTFVVPYINSWCQAAERVMFIPDASSELTFDPRQVLLLQEDRKDAAAILQTQAGTIQQLHSAGFDPDAIVAAVTDGDLATLVGNHTGLSSVQLLPPGAGDPAPSTEEKELQA